MKKLLALLLAAAMLLTLSACGKKDKNDAVPTVDVTGNWSVSINLNGLLGMGAIGDVNDILQMMGTQNLDLKMTTDFTFQEGRLTVDPAGLSHFFTNLFTAVNDWLATDAGSTAFDDYCQKNNLDKDACREQIADDTLPDQMANELVRKMGDAAYEVEGDKLHLWNPSADKNPDNYYRFTYAENVITVIEVVENGQATELNDGDFVLKKK